MLTGGFSDWFYRICLESTFCHAVHLEFIHRFNCNNKKTSHIIILVYLTSGKSSTFQHEAAVVRTVRNVVFAFPHLVPKSTLFNSYSNKCEKVHFPHFKYLQGIESKSIISFGIVAKLFHKLVPKLLTGIITKFT